MTSKFKGVHKICSALKFLTIFDAEILLKFYKVLRQGYTISNCIPQTHTHESALIS